MESKHTMAIPLVDHQTCECGKHSSPYDEGYYAYTINQSPDESPYYGDVSFQDWLLGWYDAEDDLEKLRERRT